jgi:3-oxoacid CoA-transferase subunit B
MGGANGPGGRCEARLRGHGALRRRQSQILKQCSLPLTGVAVVDHIVTELAVIDVTPEGLLLREIAEHTTVAQVQALTEPKLLFPLSGVKVMGT